MRLDDEQEDSNFEDRRGQGFGGGPMMIGGGGLGLVAVVVIGLLLGVDPRTLLGSLEQAQPPGQTQPAAPAGAAGPSGAQDAEVVFSRKVLNTTRKVWTDIFAARGQTYAPPVLVVYDGQTQTGGCGAGQAAMGPFYCPGDRKVYLDLSFFNELSTRFGAGGDFARGYVIAHEVGHHVQNLLGVSDQAQALEVRSSKVAANRVSVRVELQADCYAGVWANHIQARLDPGDIEEGLRAASAVGDDTLQKQAQGRVVPDAFTHGTSAQRAKWFKTGYSRGDMDDCDTFGARDL